MSNSADVTCRGQIVAAVRVDGGVPLVLVLVADLGDYVDGCDLVRVRQHRGGVVIHAIAREEQAWIDRDATIRSRGNAAGKRGLARGITHVAVRGIVVVLRMAVLPVESHAASRRDVIGRGEIEQPTGADGFRLCRRQSNNRALTIEAGLAAVERAGPRGHRSKHVVDRPADEVVVVLRAEPHGESIEKLVADGCAIGGEIIAAHACLKIGFELSWQSGDDIDSATHGVAAVERRRRTSQDLDAFDVLHCNVLPVHAAIPATVERHAVQHDERVTRAGGAACASTVHAGFRIQGFVETIERARLECRSRNDRDVRRHEVDRAFGAVADTMISSESAAAAKFDIE